MVPAQCRVALLSGGNSEEKEISCLSGKGAREALLSAGFQVDEFNPQNKKDLISLINGNYDVAFLCLHGRGGEDGAIQGFLETIGLPYIGSGIWASASAMNKVLTKRIYRAAGIKTLPSVELNGGEFVPTEKIIETLGEKCVVKAASGGSSIGVYIAEGVKSVDEAIKEALKIDREVVVEKYIKGRELTVSVFGCEEIRALPVIEIKARNEFYDFDAKYSTGGSKHICPAQIDGSTAKSVQEEAIKAHRALRCEGVSRTDFIVDENGLAWALETNTIPGMTKTSLLPDAAQVAGISFPKVCSLLVEFALKSNEGKNDRAGF